MDNRKQCCFHVCLTGAILPPQDSWHCLETVLVVTTVWGCVPLAHWVEIGEPAVHTLPMHRTPLPATPKNVVVPNVPSARVERLDNTLDSSSPLKLMPSPFPDHVMGVRAVVFLSDI